MKRFVCLLLAMAVLALPVIAHAATDHPCSIDVLEVVAIDNVDHPATRTVVATIDSASVEIACARSLGCSSDWRVLPSSRKAVVDGFRRPGPAALHDSRQCAGAKAYDVLVSLGRNEPLRTC